MRPRRHEGTKGCVAPADGCPGPNLHRNNAAEWVMIVAVAPAVLVLKLWARLTRARSS